MTQQTWTKLFSKALSCGVLGLAMTGCGPASEQASQPMIYGGNKAATGSWSAAVALTLDGSMFCSGTAVNPRLVITAAHCVKGVSGFGQTGVYIGNGVEGGRVTAQYKVVKKNYSPKYANRDNDIAYLVLDKPLDLPESAYIPVLVDDEETAQLLKEGNTAHLVGFGNRDGGGFGVKYEADAEITKVTTNEVAIGGDGKDSCQGDSGGPAYGKLPNGEYRVFGVVSRGGACGYGGIWGIMRANICWIQEDSGIDLALPAGTCD